MNKSATITVTAAKGRVVPVHSSTASGLGGRQLRITDADVVELPNNMSTRRRIKSGDLIEVKADTKAAPVMHSKKKES